METVLVRHRTNHKNGSKEFNYMDGVATLERSGRDEIRFVKARYITGEIMDHVGEVWKVKPSSNGKATYETISENY